MKPKIFIGENIRQSHTMALKEIQLPDLIELIRAGEMDLQSTCKRLRAVWRLDRKAYREMKTALPFFCFSQFKNGLRKLENLEAAYGLILDIDLPEKYLDQRELVWSRVISHPSVLFGFRSPSGNGIKLAFAFAQPLQSAIQFSQVYKRFQSFFAKEYELESCIDAKTFDASRVSFLSHDPDLFYNPEAIPLDTGAIFPDASLFAELSEENKEGNEKKELDEAVYKAIHQTLFPESIKRKKPAAFVPELLEEVKPLVLRKVEEEGAQAEVIPIQYGLKFRIRRGLVWAETNVFYGKRGFSVVISPKSDTNPEFNQLAANWIYSILFPEPISSQLEESHEALQEEGNSGKPF